jgi:hypothetical protein
MYKPNDFNFMTGSQLNRMLIVINQENSIIDKAEKIKDGDYVEENWLIYETIYNSCIERVKWCFNNIYKEYLNKLRK